MSDKLGVLYQNLVDDSTTVLTASHESGDRIDDKLQTVDITDIWRANSLTPNLVLDFASAVTIRCIQLVNTNLTNAATWRIRGATSQANLTSAPGYDSGDISAWPAASGAQIRNNINPFHFINGGSQFRWWRIDISDAANTDGVIDAGRLVMGNAFQPEINAAFGLRLGAKDLARSGRTRGGQPDFDKIGILRYLEFALPQLTFAEAHDSILDMDLLNGITSDVLVFPLPLRFTEQWHVNVIWGTMVNLAPIELLSSPGSKMRFNKRIRVEERL